jgi:hypothetical protein
MNDVGRIYFGNSKFSGRDIHVGDSGAVRPGGNRRQEVILM